MAPPTLPAPGGLPYELSQNTSDFCGGIFRYLPAWLDAEEFRK
jgi:hypothetical protein